MTRRHERTVLGIGINEDSVRAVLWQRDTVAWVHESLVSPDQGMREVLQGVLALAPQPRHGNHPVAVAVGPCRSQLKRIRNLPAVRDRRALDAIVQQSAGRYFRQNGTPIRTTSVAMNAPGEGWAGAIEEPLVQMVMDLCWAAGHREVVVVPTAAVLHPSGSDESLSWRDGDVMLQVRYEAGALADCRCIPHAASVDAHSAARMLDPGLHANGPDALRHGDAYGAARGGFNTPLALRIDSALQRVSPARMIPVGIVFASSLLLLVLAPAFRASREEQVALAMSTALENAATSANAAQGQLSEDARTLGELVRFQRGAPSTLLLLASMTQHIKAPSSILSLRLDPDGGTLTGVTPSSSNLIAALRDVPGIATPTILGAVTPESPPATLGPSLIMQGPSTPPAPVMQRVTIRFHWEGERPVQNARLRVR